MSGFDVEKLLQEVSADEPCGANLEYDAEYLALEREIQGVPEQVMGAAVIEARGADWVEVRRRAVALFDRTKDLRIGVHLTRALLLTGGLPAFVDGLTLLHRLIGDYWDGVYPRLDPDDDNDPAVRVNIVTALSDPETVLKDLRGARLVVSRTFGAITYRDIALVTGEIKPVGDEKPKDLNAVKAAFKDCDAEELQAVAGAAQAAFTSVGDIEKALTERVGVASAADFSPLARSLRALARFLQERLAERGLGSAAPEEEAEAGATGRSGAAPARSAAAAAVSGEISSRDDVTRVLDKVCEYFERYEPSSPIPLLLRRAKRLVGKSFLEIMRDMVPDGVAQAEHFRGSESEEAA